MKKLTTTLCLTVALLFGCAGVCKSGDWNKGQAAYKRGDYATALREWAPLAKRGDANAQNSLGPLYKYGWGVPKSYKTAVMWYRLAARQGNASAQLRLGGMYERGLGVPKDLKTAIKWTKLAAEQGYPPAQNIMGLSYLDHHYPKDYVRAYTWLKIAESFGD